MNKEISFGPVKVVKGRYAGLVGFYDDDAEHGLAVVYFGFPTLSPYVLIKRGSLVNAPDYTPAVLPPCVSGCSACTTYTRSEA